jgi:hypothetical protein
VTSVTKEEPGGDAASAEVAALDRLAAEGWGARGDRGATMLVPLTDAEHWRRVKFWMFDPFTGFRYGDAHHAVAGMYLIDVPPGPFTSEACLKAFERWAQPLIRGMEIELTQPVDLSTTWRGVAIAVRTRDATVLWGPDKRLWAGVYGAFAHWPGTCAILAYAFAGDDDATAARKARDRFAREAYRGFIPRSEARPRLPDEN